MKNKKTNKRKVNTKKEKEKLKNRYKIEHPLRDKSNIRFATKNMTCSFASECPQRSFN